jgi:thiamine monophosphate synthase
MYTYLKYNKYFFLTDTINDEIKNKIKKFSNFNIIYYDQNKTVNKDINLDKYNQIYNFCKKNKIPIYITNNFKLLLKLKADGIFLTSKNIPTTYQKIKSKTLIGLAHNQIEYYFKEKQGCDIVMLSPLFFNKKYSTNEILGTTRFNLITKNWKTKVGALGGINASNINKVKILQKVDSIAFISWLKKK